MRNNVLTVMKKECARIFGDKKLFFTAVILPGLMLFVMYFFIGAFMATLFTVEDDYIYQIHTINLPASIAEILPLDELEILPAYEHEIDEIREKIRNRETDVLLVFPENFDEIVENFDREAGDIAPNIEVWSNMTRTESNEASWLIRDILHAHHFDLTHLFRINCPEEVPGGYDLATDADVFAMVMGMMIPMLFVIFIYSGCLSIAPESIAGEKERGTLGAILATPARRRDIALGKILGIAIFSLMSAVVSIFAALFAMPGMMVGMEMEGGILAMYSALDFVLLFLITISTTLVFVSLLCVLSAYAKSIKEATSYAMPVMMIVVAGSLVGMILGEVPDSPIYFLIPVVNSALSIASIFAPDVLNTANILIATVTNFVLALIFTVILAKIFGSERIVFDK